MLYVDDFVPPWGRTRWVHLMSDDVEELHKAAQEIGVERRWYQGTHYDIPLAKREAALAYGAKAITWRQAGAMMEIRRATGEWVPPREALRRFHELKGTARSKRG